MNRSRIKSIIAVLSLLSWCVPTQCLAYVYPEHRKIALIGITNLDDERSARLSRLWADARMGHEARLSETPADPAASSGTIDYASWPAIAGDHSCSASDMLNTVLHSDWILEVSRVASTLGASLEEAGGEKFRRTNALRSSDFDFLSVDPEYATRAGSNNVHFLLPRVATERDLQSYLMDCTREGSDNNAIAVYVLYHYRALIKAQKVHRGGISQPERSDLVRSMLADEAFSLHFLQDAFAAGHVAGSWGDASLRKGTHDFYNENGLEVTTWEGESFVILGDAWMRDVDAERAAGAVRGSLEQLLDVAAGSSYEMDGWSHVSLREESPDVCSLNVVPAHNVDGRFILLIAEIIGKTPIPGLESGHGGLPRFNAELGPFVGLASAFNAGWHGGGFLVHQTGTGFKWGIEVAARIGLGVEGVMNESGDGLIYLDAGVARESASTLNIAAAPSLDELGAITAAIPSRTTVLARLRVPFYVLPFDLLIAAPILALTSPETFTQMAVVAANGGFFGWQAGIATSVGRFQFILGREVGVFFYGLNKDNDRVLTYPEGRTDELYLMDIKSIQLLFPVLDYRNFRTFSRDQSSSLHLQLFAGVDIPTSVEVVVPQNAAVPDSRVIWQVGIRASLDWRYYF